MNKFKSRRYLYTLLTCGVGLGLFLILTNPNEVSIGLLVVPVVLLFLMVFSVVQIFLTGLGLIGGRPGKRRIVALTSASLITVVMILQSTGGISVADLILLALIVVVSAIYIEKF